MRTVALIAFFLATASACTTDPELETEPLASEPAEGMRWICYTHATCDGDQVDEQHPACFTGGGVVVQGDRAATDWANLWDAACRVNEGVFAQDVEKLRHPGYCPGGTWGCRVECRPQYVACD